MTRSKSFGEPEDRYKYKRTGFGLVLSLFVCLIGVAQTKLFVTALPCPSNEAIRKHVVASLKLQKEQATRYAKKSAQVPDGIVFELFDTDVEFKQLEETKAALLSDDALQKDLRDSFGASFQEVNAVVVPAWKLQTSDNNDVIGITMDGWRQAVTAKGEVDVGGFTLRDRPGRVACTLDGRPRLVLNPKAFESARMLRLTLFHELMHAINVPGFYPSPVTFAQNDLTYLPEYRAYVKQQKLEGWDEWIIWALAVFMPALISALLAKRLVQLRRALALS